MEPGGTPEKERVEQARTGDAHAFSLLVHRHRASVYAWIRRMVRDSELAEELTQDVFIKAHRGLAKFRGEAGFRTWLFRIAVNRVRDHRTSRRAHQEAKEVRLPEGGIDTHPALSIFGPEAALDEVEMAGAFEATLAGLEPHLREAFLFRHQEGLGYEEIGQALGISPGNARVRVHRARERVLTELRERGFDV